jgi:hypothetical protein
MRSINLWECLTKLESLNAKDQYVNPKVTDDDMVALGNSGRWHGQELSLEPREDGWLIKVFSCYSEDCVTGIEILIPKDGPVKILKDRNGMIEYHH